MPLPLSDRVPVALGGKDVLTMLLIADVLTLLLLIKDCCRSAFRCCVVVCNISRLPLPLSDCVPVDAEGRHGDKDVDRERVDIVDAAKGLLSETNKHFF